MTRLRTSLLWLHTATLAAVALLALRYSSKPLPEITLLVEFVHQAVTSWFHPEPFLAFFLLSLLGWIFGTFRLFSVIGYAIGSVLSLCLFAWWAVLLGPGDVVQRLPEFFLLGSILVGLAAFSPFRPVSLLALEAVRYGIIPVMTLHQVLSSLNSLFFIPAGNIYAVSTLARHAARARTDLLLRRVHESFSLKIEPALPNKLVAAMKDEHELGSKAVPCDSADPAVHPDRLTMVYSTLMLVESHEHSEYPSDSLFKMFDWDPGRHVDECYRIFDKNPKTQDRICAASTLFKKKQWSLLLHSGESFEPYPIRALKLRAAEEILLHLKDKSTPECREVLASKNQLMRELHLTGCLSDVCVLLPTSPLSLSTRSESHHLEKTGFTAPFTFAKMPIFDGTPGLRLATLIIVLLTAWVGTERIGLEVGDSLRRYSTSYLPEADPRRLAEDDHITEIHSLSGQPIVARVKRAGSEVVAGEYLRIDPQTYDIDVIKLPSDMASSERVLVDSFQAPNGFHILTGSSTNPQNNLAHFLLPPDGSEEADWRTIHAPTYDFDLGTVLDSRWLTPDMQLIVGTQGMCLYQPSTIAAGLTGYQYLPYSSPRVDISDALLTKSELHLVFEYASEVQYARTNFSSIKQAYESFGSSLQALFAESRVLPRFEIGEELQIHPGPSSSIFVQGSQGSLLHIDDNIHIVRWGQLPDLRNPEIVFLGNYALAFDQSRLLLHRSSEIEPSSWWATKNLTLGKDGALNEVDLFSEPLPDCFLAVHESDSRTQLTLLVHKRELESETGLLYRFKIDPSGRINDGELFIPDVVDFSVSSDGQNCALTARFSRSKDDKAKYEVLLTFSGELAGTQDFDHGEQDRLSAFQKFLPLALFDNRNQLAVRSPMPPAFVGQQLALSFDPQNELHSMLTSSGEIQAYSEARLSSVGNVEQLPSFPTGKNVTVDFFTDRGVNHVLTVQPNHQVDRWIGEVHQPFSWHLPRWGSPQPDGNPVTLSPGSDDFVISDGASLYHHGVSGGWRLLSSPVSGSPIPANKLFSLSPAASRQSLLFSIVGDESSSILLEVQRDGGDVQSHRLPTPVDSDNGSWLLSPVDAPKFVFRSTDSSGAARWFSWDKKDLDSPLHSADPSNAAGKVIDLCDLDLSSKNDGLLILGEGGLNYCRNTKLGLTRQFVAHFKDPGGLFKPSQLVDTSSDVVWALYESGDKTKPALVTSNLKVLQNQPTLLTSSVTTDPGQGFVGLSYRTRAPVQFGSSTECVPLLPNARFDFEHEGLEVVRWLPGQDHLHLVALSSEQENQNSLFTLDGFGRLQQSLPDLRFDGDIQSAHLIGPTTHIFTDKSWYSLSGTQNFREQRSGRWFANSFPDDKAGLAWQLGNSEGNAQPGKALGLGRLNTLQLPGARTQSSGSPSPRVPAFRGPQRASYLAAKRGIYRWGGVAQGFTSFQIPVRDATDIQTWLRSDRSGAPIAVVQRKGEGPSFYEFDFATGRFVDLEIDLNGWSQDSPEHAWAVGWRGSDWFSDVENLRLVSKQGEKWGGWSTGRLGESPEVWNVEGREYLLDESGRLLRLDVRAGQWRALFGGQKFLSIHPVPKRSSDVASEQTQFVARSRTNSNTWTHLQLGRSEREYSELVLMTNTEPSYDSERFLGFSPDGQNIIDYTWRSQSLQKYRRPGSASARVHGPASSESVWAKQGSLFREINLSSGQWSSERLDTKPGSVIDIEGEKSLLLYKDRSSATPHLVRSGRSPRMLTRATAGYQLVGGWDAIAISEESGSVWLVSDGETNFQVPHKIFPGIGKAQATIVEDNNLLVVSDKGVSRFVNDEWLDVTRSLPVEMGVVDNNWCYLQNGTLFDQSGQSLPGYSGVQALFSSPRGTVVVDRDWRCTWHNLKDGRTDEILDPNNYLHKQSQRVSNAAQFPLQGPARFLTWSSQGKTYVHLPNGNPPQEFSGPPPMIWLSPSYSQRPFFNRKLNIIFAKSQSGEPELITRSSAYFAADDMLFFDGTQIQEPKQTISIRALTSSSGAQFLRIPGAGRELHFERSASGTWAGEPRLEWTQQLLVGPSGTLATLVIGEDNDSVGYFTAGSGRPQEVIIKSFDQVDDKTLDTILNDVFGSEATNIPATFCDRVFLQFDSGATVSFEITKSSTIEEYRSDVVVLAESETLTLPYVIEDGQIGIRHEGDFLPMWWWDRAPKVVQGGQKSWGRFIPSANGVESATNWILSGQLPTGVQWSNDGPPLIQRGSRIGLPTAWSSTSISGHLSLGSNPSWTGDPVNGMVHRGKPLGKLTPQGFESHLRMRRKEFVPISYQGSLGVIRVLNDKLWLQSALGWKELPRGMESKVVRGPSAEVSVRPSTTAKEIVNGTLLRWDPSQNSIGCVQGSTFYPLALADFSQANPFLCTKPSGFGYRSGSDEKVVFSYSISGQEYQSASANLSFPDVLKLLRQRAPRPSPTTASVPNSLPPSRIQNVKSSLLRLDDRFALSWHLVDQVRPTRTPSESIVISNGNGSNYVIGADGNVQEAKPLRPLPRWSDADDLPFRPASDPSKWEIQLPTVSGQRQWIPAGVFDRGNFALLQLDASAELRKFDDDVWTIEHGGLSLGWSVSANEFVVAPGQGTSAPRFTTQCGSYEVSITGGQFDRISHSDIGVLAFDANKENTRLVTSGGWLQPFEPQDIQYVQSVTVGQEGDPVWCVRLPDNSWVTLNEESMRWNRSGPPRGAVDSPVLKFGLLAGLSRKQIRENRIETPLDVDLGVFKFEIPGQLRVGFDRQGRIVVIADKQSYVVDLSSGIKLSPEAEISVVQSATQSGNSNLVLGLSSAALEAGGTTYKYTEDGKLTWSPYPELTLQESDQSGVFDHNRSRRAFFTTASNRVLTTFDGGFVVRGPKALSIYPDGSVKFQRDLDGELHASTPVDCETTFGNDYKNAVFPEVMRRTYAVSADGWVLPDQSVVGADGRLPNSRLGWIGVYSNGVAEIVGDRSRFLTRDQSGISRPKISFKDLPGEISEAQHLNGGLFIENPKQSFAVELSEHLELGVEGLRSVRHDWSPIYQTGLTISTQSIQTGDGGHVVTTKSLRRQPKNSGVLEEPSSIDLTTFRSHAIQDVTTVLREDGADGLSLYILGSSLSRIDFDESTGSSEFVKMYDPESSEEVAVSSAGELYLRADGADWLGLLNGKPIGEDPLGSRWVNETLEAFSGTFDWTLWEDPNGVLKYSSSLHDSLKDRVLSEDLTPEWPWDQLVAAGFDFDTLPDWSSSELHLRRSEGFPSPTGSLSNQKSAFAHARQKKYSEQGSAHVPVECPFPNSPSIPLRGFPLSASLQDGSLALDIENQVPVLIDLSSDVRYPVDFGDGSDAPVANAERIDDDLWILDQTGQLRWVPIMEEWLLQLVDEDLTVGELPTENADPSEPSESIEADAAEQQ